jgi:hypothetical protein
VISVENITNFYSAKNMPPKPHKKPAFFQAFPPPRLMKSGVRCHLPYALPVSVFQSTTITNTMKRDVDSKNKMRFLCNHVQFGVERKDVPNGRAGEKHNYA